MMTESLLLVGADPGAEKSLAVVVGFSEAGLSADFLVAEAYCLITSPRKAVEPRMLAQLLWADISFRGCNMLTVKRFRDPGRMLFSLLELVDWCQERPVSATWRGRRRT